MQFDEGALSLAQQDWIKSLDDVRASVGDENYDQWLIDNAHLPVAQRGKKSTKAKDRPITGG